VYQVGNNKIFVGVVFEPTVLSFPAVSAFIPHVRKMI